MSLTNVFNGLIKKKPRDSFPCVALNLKLLETNSHFLYRTNVRLGEYDTANSGPDCVEVEGGEPGTLDCTSDLVIIPIERIIPHPDYNSLKRNDIAMLRLQHTAQYTGKFLYAYLVQSIKVSNSSI